MFYQIYICLTRPLEIGRFLLDRISRSVFTILFLIVLALTPYVVSLSIADAPNHDNYNVISESMMSSGDDFTLKIENGILTGDKALSFSLDDTNLLIAPNNEQYHYSNIYDELTPLLTYEKEKVTVKVLGAEIYSKSYSDMEIKEIDFTKIMNEDYLEMNKFFESLTEVFNDVHVSWVTYYSIQAFFEIVFMSFMGAWCLSVLARIFKRGMNRQFGFKIGLDCQPIMIFSVFIAYLCGTYWIQYIGSALSTVFLFFALKSIISIKQEPVNKEENGNA